MTAQLDDPCFECGAPATERHHVVPRCRGGTKTVPLCTSCHGRVHGIMRPDDLNERIRKGLEMRRQQGKKTGGDIPYGFRIKRGRLVPSQFERVTIAYMKELRRRGLTLRQIARRLDKLGVRPKKRGRWQSATIFQILKREKT